MAKAAVISVQQYDGAWQILGQDAARGIEPEIDDITVDEHGPKTAAFTLKRQPGAFWPDIRKYAKVLIEIAGVDVWGGRVSDTPVKDGTDTMMSVQCEGAQAHLDDDVYERKYIVTDLSAWQDRRSNLATVVGSGGACASGQVSNDGGLTLMFAKDTTVAASDDCGVMLDMGPGQTAARIVYEGTSSANNNGTPQCQFYLLAGPSPSGLDATVLVGPQALTTIGAGFGPTPVDLGGHRYVFLVLHWNAGGTVGNDAWIKFSSIQVFADTAYESGNASTLTLDTITEDALDRASVLFDADRSLIEAPDDVFYIPEFSFTEPRTPRQAIEAGNAFEDMQYGVDHRWRPFLRNRPDVAAAEVEIGAWSASESEDQGDGDDIYNRCIVKASGPDGSPIRAERTQGQQIDAVDDITAEVSAGDPTFASGTTDWTASGSTITRTTSVYDSSPASGRWDNTGASDALGIADTLRHEFLGGSFEKGRIYYVAVKIRAGSGVVAPPQFTFGDDASGDYVATSDALSGGGNVAQGDTLPDTLSTSLWRTVTLCWMPRETRSLARVILLQPQSWYYVDSVRVAVVDATIVDRAGFRRTKVIDASFMLTDAAGTRIADKYLQGHKTSPFKGRRTLAGPRSVRNSLTGQYEGLERLLLRYGQPLMDTSAIDPDTGLPGRAGRIATVTYRPAVDTAVVELDNSRANFEQLLERIGLVVGQGTR